MGELDGRIDGVDVHGEVLYEGVAKGNDGVTGEKWFDYNQARF
jgi:hypothetical protein